MTAKTTGNSYLLPDRTAVRTALWRALHLEVDSAPHVLHDDIGLKLLEPAGGWRKRHDMLPAFTARSRATIVARARFIEDLVLEKARQGVRQYVLLGAGLDTFAFRRPHGAEAVRVFEVDQPIPQAWKREKLIELGFGIPEWLRLVPVDFEGGDDWMARLAEAGFDAGQPAVVASAGVAVFLTPQAILAKLRQMAGLAPGSTLVMTFLLPNELLDPEDRAVRPRTQTFALKKGTPWRSFFTPPDMMALAREAGFKDVRHVTAADLTRRYFAGRPDGLRPSSGEEILVATTGRMNPLNL
jgi:methyltransferase (TIGR00027 family)